MGAGAIIRSILSEKGVAVMALLTLKDIGKIYVSEGNVTVGIRGVNLSFDRGEFVAITGKSGSGKSTLLNVISGMDSYEEGELYIEDQPTSHYLQPDWEEFREKYISFIFQDYNIIESFTVLQNVELALMHIEDPKVRRQRALKLISRVGLVSHVNHKGSKLSGGQKQRTVIARALAKDSPIILADEPTGNLDSATSKEIIELLKEVSKDKLLIVVTHNFEQVESCATRHVRIYDGAVESDHKLAPPNVSGREQKAEKPLVSEKSRTFKNGITLGRSIFTSKPKLSTFLCLLMIIGMLGIFSVTAFCGEALDIFDGFKMFEHIDGRVVITSRNGSPITDEQLDEIVKEYGAKSYIHYDLLLDEWSNSYVEIIDGDKYHYISFKCTYGEDFGNNIIGEYPKADDEVFLYLPITYKPLFGEKKLEREEIELNGVKFKVSGVKYYYDNNIEPRCLFTKEGFETMTAVYYLSMSSNISINVTVYNTSDNTSQNVTLYSALYSRDVEDGKICVISPQYDSLIKRIGEGKYTTNVSLSATYYQYNYDNYYESSKTYSTDREFGDADIGKLDKSSESTLQYSDVLLLSHSVYMDIVRETLKGSYRQASVFFENDKEAAKAAEELNENGYIAVTSDTTYEPYSGDAILAVLECLVMAFVWVLMIVFLAFFINLCSGRSMSAFKGDMAIMRSMGIQVKVIRIAMYVRMFISLIPACILMAVSAVYVYTSPALNQHFTYLYAWQYALILLGMILLTFRVTYKQMHKLFGESVKKSLKRGDVQ